MKKLAISFLKKTITAKKDPICKLMLRIKSSWIKFMNLENKIIWEEELMGKNSVIPWTKDSIKISNILIFIEL